jgi:hypothetical protein
MNNNRTNPDEGALDEPTLTQKNSATVHGEEILAEDDSAESNRNEEPGLNTASVRTSYGAGGGTTDATEEGGDGTGI